ncbi:MAG: hypothetical protein QXU18_01225 [Thermoplasmatales archaeon]
MPKERTDYKESKNPQLNATGMKEVQCSRLRSKFEILNRDISMSLVDYRNNYFTSDDPHRIIEFYSGFENREQFIQWMKERPKDIHTVYDVEGGKDIIVVIPTDDYNGKYAKECRENIFKGLNIIFVESGGRDDFYFNYTHNCNIGVKKAMEYNPKCIMLSNDDMYKIDDVEKLTVCLEKVDDNQVNIVHAKKTMYHTVPLSIFKMIFSSKLYSLVSGDSAFNENCSRFNIRYGLLPDTSLRFKKIKSTLKSFIFRRIKGTTFYNGQSIGIFNSVFISTNRGQIFDKSYINGTEEVDVSYSLRIRTEEIQAIDYQIGGFICSTLLTTMARRFPNIAGNTYFFSKYQDHLDSVRRKDCMRMITC